jgi:hypothetical protein
MVLVFTTTVGLMLSIVLRVIGFGRRGDAFVVRVLPILLLSPAFKIATRNPGGGRG